MDETLEVCIERSRRKTTVLSVVDSKKVLVKTSKRMPKREIYSFVEKNMDWIEKRISILKRQEERQKDIVPLTKEEYESLKLEAKKIFKERVDYFASIMGLEYNRISIKNQKTRWGSCSVKKNLNFNIGLMLAPRDVLDYVVIHELCHLIEMNHSRAFWKHVEKLMPDYRAKRKWLKENGDVVMCKLKLDEA